MTDTSSSTSGPSSKPLLWSLNLDDGRVQFSHIPRPSSRNLTAQPRPNSFRSKVFSSLISLTHELEALDPASEYYVDPASAKAARAIIEHLSQMVGEPPRLLPLDGESITLTWDKGRFKRFLTLAGDDASVLDMGKMSLLRCNYTLDLSDPASRHEFLEQTAGPTSAGTSDFADDI